MGVAAYLMLTVAEAPKYFGLEQVTANDEKAEIRAPG